METKIVFLDLDDVLADSIPFWIDYVKKEIKDSEPPMNTKGDRAELPPEIVNAGLLKLKRELPYAVYKFLKNKYRSGRTKLDIPLKEGARELVDTLIKRKYIIIIMTKRPFERYPSLRVVTELWLRENKIPYLGIVNGPVKHLEALKYYPEPRFYVDDRLATARQFARWGYKGFLVNTPMNTRGGPYYEEFSPELSKLIVRVSHLKEIVRYLDDAII
jgi:FMN phosphatase YigB (HAD superfamily)